MTNFCWYLYDDFCIFWHLLLFFIFFFFFAFTPFYTSLYLNGIVLLVSFRIVLFPLVIQSFHAQNLSYIEYILLLLSFCCFLLFEWWNNVVDSLCYLSLQWFWRRMFLDDCCWHVFLGISFLVEEFWLLHVLNICGIINIVQILSFVFHL
jgi:hypothetical protein